MSNPRTVIAAAHFMLKTSVKIANIISNSDSTISQNHFLYYFNIFIGEPGIKNMCSSSIRALNGRENETVCVLTGLGVLKIAALYLIHELGGIQSVE